MSSLECHSQKNCFGWEENTSQLQYSTVYLGEHGSPRAGSRAGPRRCLRCARARARGARPACAGKGTENAPSPPENSGAHLENGNLFIYQSSHVHDASIPPIHRPSSSSHELARPSLKRHAGYTTAGPGTVAFGFVASAAAAAVASLSREYFVAAPMTTMVAN